MTIPKQIEFIDLPQDETNSDTGKILHIVFSVPISVKPLNYYNNQLIMKFITFSPANPVTEHIIQYKKRIHIQLDNNDALKNRLF